MWFMGIDMGTSGCKAVVFDERWQIAAQAYREYPMHFPGEGLLELDKYIDNCVLSHIQNLRIIHGKGTGALRAAVHQYLRQNKSVRTFRLGVFGEGESGVTVVELK